MISPMISALFSARGAVALAAAAAVAASGPHRPAPVVDGMTYTFRSTAQQGGETGEGRIVSSMLARGQVAGGKARIDFLETKNQALMTAGDYMLVRDGGRLTLVSPKQKSYFDIDMAAIGQVFTALGNSGGLMKFTVSEFSADVAKLGAGEPLLGNRTERYRMVQHYVMAVRILGMSRSTTRDDTTDYWFGPSVRDLANPFDARSTDAALSFFGNSPDAADKLRAAIAKLPKQVALRTVMRGVAADGKGKRDVTRVTSEVTELARGNIDASVFEIPAGYTMTESPTGALSAMGSASAGSGAATGASASGSGAAANAGAARTGDTTSIVGATKNGMKEGVKEGAKEGARDGARKAVRGLFGRP